MIITTERYDTLSYLSNEYAVPADKIASDNGLGPGQEPVNGQSLVIAQAENFFVPPENTTVAEISGITQTSQKNIFRNNYFLGGKQDVEQHSYVVLSYGEKLKEKKIIGGYAYDFISNSILHSVINYLTYIMPFTYGFTENGELIEPKDDYILTVASENEVTALMHVSTLTEEGVFDSELPGKVFDDVSVRDRLIDNIINKTMEKNYGGVDVDFEFLPAKQKDKYVIFLTYLSNRLHEIGKILVVALPPKTSDEQPGRLYEGADYGEIGKISDYVLVMTYEPPITSYTPNFKIKAKEKQRNHESPCHEKKRCEKMQDE